MRASLAQLHQRLGVTTVYVTHDQTEAMTLGQRVAVMRDGRIQQIARPKDLYERPDDLFIAAFIGSPAMNLVEATIEGDDACFGQYRVPLSAASRPPGRPRAGRGRAAPRGLRRRGVRAGRPTISVRVEVLEELGSDAHIFFTVDAPPMTAEALETAVGGGLPADPGPVRGPGRPPARPRGSATSSSSPSTPAGSISSTPTRARGWPPTACRSWWRIDQAERDAGQGAGADRRARGRRGDPLRAPALSSTSVSRG